MAVDFPFPGLKADYPQVTTDQSGCRRMYMYRGPSASYTVLCKGLIYLGHPIENFLYATVDLTDLVDVTITTIQASPPVDGDGNIVDTAEGTDGTFLVPAPVTTGAPAEVTDGQYPFIEIEWASLEKPLRQHPAFSDFTATDWAAVESWEKETDTAAKIAFQYWNRDNEGKPTGSIQTLSDTDSPDNSPKDYAKLRLRGVEAFQDAAPVARMTNRFRGWNAPATGDAGQKAGSDPFSGVPSGYEWLKTVDRSSKQGFGTEWLQQQEWTGARLILLDKDTIYT